MIRAHQPGSEPIDIPETIPNPVVVPTPTPTEPAPKEPVRIPEKVPESAARTARKHAVLNARLNVRLGGVEAMLVVVIVRPLRSTRPPRAAVHAASPFPCHGRRPASFSRPRLGATPSRFA